MVAAKPDIDPRFSLSLTPCSSAVERVVYGGDVLKLKPSSTPSPPPSSFQADAACSMDSADWLKAIAGEDPPSPTPMLLDDVSPSPASSSCPSPKVTDVNHQHLLPLAHRYPLAPAPLDRKPQQLRPQHVDPLRCPRCDSVNTKFCYYNNYSLSQPRYFCKTCRRYWTKGGSLRNVPVGGGCRKSKRGPDGSGAKNNKLFGAAAAAAPAAASGEIYGHHPALPLPLHPFSPAATAAHHQAALGALDADVATLLGFAAGGSTGTELQLSSAAAFSAFFPHLSLVSGGALPLLANFKECKYEQTPFFDAPLNQQQQHLGCSGDVAAAEVAPVPRNQFFTGNDIRGINVYGAFHTIDPPLGFSADNSCDDSVGNGDVDSFHRQRLALPWTVGGSPEIEPDVIEIKPAVGKLLPLEWQLGQQSGCANVGTAEQIGPFGAVSGSATVARMWGEVLNGHGVHGTAPAYGPLV